MKKKLLTGITVCFFLFGMVGLADATLIVQGSGVLFDDVNGNYWFQDIPAFSDMTYDEQILAIDDLNSASSLYTSNKWLDWRMATASDLGNLVSGLITSSDLWTDIQLFNHNGTTDASGNFISNCEPGQICTDHLVGRLSSDDYGNGPGYHDHGYINVYYEIINGERTRFFTPFGDDVYYGVWGVEDSSKSWVSAWVVADAACLPEPATILLFGTGIAGLIGKMVRRKKK